MHYPVLDHTLAKRRTASRVKESILALIVVGWAAALVTILASGLISTVGWWVAR